MVFEMLQKLPAINFEIIFTTSYDQYAIKAFKFSALDYLLKPVDRQELEAAVQKVVQTFVPSCSPATGNSFAKALSTCFINQEDCPSYNGRITNDPDRFDYKLRLDSNYTIFQLKNKQKLIVSRLLREVEEMLEEYSFLRVHHSYVVNLNEIEKYYKGDGGYVVMSDGSSIDVSRNKKDVLLTKLRPNRI
jgi:two-component system LytT family response regulator